MKVRNVVKKVAAVGTGIAMLGASITGAVALDLGDYPAPFVNEGVYDDGNILVIGAEAAASDTLGAVDIASNFQYESRDCSGTDTEVFGGQTEEVPLGFPLASGVSFSQILEDDDIEGMFDSKIRFKGSDYDTRDLLMLGQDDAELRIHTSLTSSEDDYHTDVVLESAKDSIKYYYVFDEPLEFGEVSYDDSLDIKFLGKSFSIVNLDSNKVTLQTADEYYMEVGGSIDVDDKTVTLTNVGAGGKVIIDVDGIKETVDDAVKTVNGIEVKVDETFYEDNKDERSATLLIGDDIVRVVKDGDPFIGEDEDEPDWIWNIGGFDTDSATAINTDGEFSGPFLGIENEFLWNDDSDNPLVAGDCIDLPYNYLKICFDSLSVKEDEYAKYVFNIDDDADFSDIEGGPDSLDALHMESDIDEGFLVDISEMDYALASPGRTDELWVWKCLEDEELAGVYYRDYDNDVALAGCFELSDEIDFDFASLNYGNVKNDLTVSLKGNLSVGEVELVVSAYDPSNLPYFDDSLVTTWTVDDGFSVSSLGASASQDESDELVWIGEGNSDLEEAVVPIGIGTKDEDFRTRYGIIVANPSNGGNSDEMVLEVPSDQVFAKFSVRGQGTVVESSGGFCSPLRISPVAKLDSEVSSPGQHNLILIGGPCVNSLVSSIFGISCEDWNLTVGEALVKLAENGENVAMLVAGTSAMDTRRAAKAVASYMDYSFSGVESLVKGTGLDDAIIE